MTLAPLQAGALCATEMHTDYGGAANICIYCHPDAPGGKAAKWQFVPGAFLHDLVAAQHPKGKTGLKSVFDGKYTVSSGQSETLGLFNAGAVAALLRRDALVIAMRVD